MRRFLPTRVAFVFAFALASSVFFTAARTEAARPLVTLVSPSNGPTVGGFPITIVGSGFDATPGQVMVGSAAAAVTDWQTSYVICTCPEGNPGSAPIVVTSSTGESSAPASFTFDAPAINSLTPGKSPAAGGVLITIHGQNFGMASTPATVTFGGVPSSAVSHLSHTSIVAASPPGTLNTRVGLQVAVSGQFSNTVDFDYDPPVVFSAFPPNAPTQGGVLITINGQNFGADATVEVQGRPASTSSVTLSRIVFTCPEGDPGPAPIEVFAGTTSSGPSSSFAFDAPTISGFSPPSMPARGGIPITIFGQNFGTASAPRSTTVGGEPVAELSYLGHTAYVVDSPPSPPGSTQPTCLELPSIGMACYDIKVDPPKAQSVTPNMGPVGGGTVITIRGENFGVSPAYSRSVTFGGAPATDVQCPNDSLMSCTLPPAPGGAGGDVDLIVVVEGSADTVATGFEYLATTGLGAGEGARPLAFAVRQNAPNPFAASTAIAFDLPEASEYSVSIFDIRGRLVRRIEGFSGIGTMHLTWDGSDASGAQSPAGVYFYRVRAGRFDETRRMLLVK